MPYISSTSSRHAKVRSQQADRSDSTRSSPGHLMIGPVAFPFSFILSEYVTSSRPGQSSDHKTRARRTWEKPPAGTRQARHPPGRGLVPHKPHTSDGQPDTRADRQRPACGGTARHRPGETPCRSDQGHTQCREAMQPRPGRLQRHQGPLTTALPEQPQPQHAATYGAVPSPTQTVPVLAQRRRSSHRDSTRDHRGIDTPGAPHTWTPHDAVTESLAEKGRRLVAASPARERPSRLR